MATAGSAPAAVFSYFGVLCEARGERDTDSGSPPGCWTLGLVMTGDPISSRVFTVEVGEGTLGWPGCGTDGFLELSPVLTVSPGIRTFGSLSRVGESAGDSTSAIVSSTLN